MKVAISTADDYHRAVERARKLVVEAIATLDDAHAPGDIAAHLDLAAHRMEQILAA
jgi:hypothetical protein